MVALDRGGDVRGERPAANQDGPDQRMVDAELATLTADPLVRGRVPFAHVRVGAVKLRQHQPADVVKKRRDGQLVAIGEPGELSDAIGRVAGGNGMAAEAL